MKLSRNAPRRKRPPVFARCAARRFAWLVLLFAFLSLGAASPAAAQFERPNADAFSLEEILPREPIDEAIAAAFALRERGDGPGAVALLEPQAEAGKLSAQMALGFMYGRGDGIPRNAERAALWWRRAADQGQGYAQFAFGEAALGGIGTEKDPVLAHAYLSIAAERTQRGGPFLDLVLFVRNEAEAALSEEQKQASAAFVARWYEAHPSFAPPPPEIAAPPGEKK